MRYPTLVEVKEIQRIYLVGDIKPILPFDQAEDIHGNTMLKRLLVSYDKYTPHGQDDCPYCLNYDCSIQCPFKKDFGMEEGCLVAEAPTQNT